MNNEPVAWMETYKGEPNNLDWDKSNLNYGSEFHDVIPLYTHPAKELNDGGEPVKNATYWKRQYNLMATQNDNLKSGLYHANEQIKYLESHPLKELTISNNEIHKEFLKLIENCDSKLSIGDVGFPALIEDFARAILRKAQGNEKT